MIARIAFVLVTGASIAFAGATAPALTQTPSVPGARAYGQSVALGEGQARAYVTYDLTGEPTEIGVALDERAMDGLPAAGSGHHGAGGMTHTSLLDLPGRTAPFEFIELNWNPAGHEPDGVYAGVPHFDFHFWIADKALRESIMPEDPTYAAKAERVPAPEYIPEHNAALAPPGAPLSAIAVPMMGVHWIDLRSPELQGLLGHPENAKPFTTTFIHGSWDGQLTFWEPMITRAYILAKKDAKDPAVRDEIIPLPTPAAYAEPGYYPTAYRITWDEDAREFRIALTQLTPQGMTWK